MLNVSFNNETIRKYTTLFGTLFNDIKIEKTDGSANSVVQTIKVPITYSRLDKMFERVKVDPNLDRPMKIQLPRMGFELSGLNYDRNRKLQTTIKFAGPQANNVSPTVYAPVPWNLQYKLHICTRTQTEGTRIVEQILPFFTPDWTPTVEIIPEMALTYDIPIVLDSVSIDDSYEGGFDEDRMIVWTLDFTLKGWLFGPVKTGGKASKLIKFTKVSFYTDTNANSASDLVTIQPGLTANGDPTTVIADTIPYTDISSDDNYGYIITTTNL